MNLTPQDIAASLLSLAGRLSPAAAGIETLDDEAYDERVRALAGSLAPELELLGFHTSLEDLHYALGLLWCSADRHASTTP